MERPREDADDSDEGGEGAFEGERHLDETEAEAEGDGSGELYGPRAPDPAADGEEDAPEPQHLRVRVPPVELHRQRHLLVLALALLMVAGVGLVMVGVDRVWSSTAGRYVAAGKLPDEPDYVALVTPTPTLLVATVDDDDVLTGVALLSLRSGDEGGSVVVMPVATRLPTSEEGAEPPSEDDVLTLGDAHADGGADGLTEAVERLFKVAVADTLQLDDAGWASLVSPVEPLELAIPDPVDGRWPAGEIELEAGETGEFLRATSDSESELNRLARQDLFWRTWLPAVGMAGESALPGEPEAGLGRFVQGLSQGFSGVTSVPVVPDVDGEREVFDAEPEQIAAIVANEIPYPQEPEAGVRIRVKLLNGTGQTDLGLRATSPLVAAGAEVAMTGNAGSFDEERTVLRYSDDAQRVAAIRLREALGVGVLEREPGGPGVQRLDEGERIDVTVILGADAPEAIRRLESTE